mmetsp:Transcript_43107/g.91874  ORF Transcript_43107/g.91874 Transcript_43107/m.91874 type:complete len:343 (-) Transcript_43107:107-1135(-)
MIPAWDGKGCFGEAGWKGEKGSWKGCGGFPMIMPPDGSWGDFGKGKGVPKKGGGVVSWFVPGLDEALTEALTPVAGEDPQWDLEEMKNRVGQKLIKAANKFAQDERASQRGTATQAKLLIEEFVDSCMDAVSASCYDKPWFNKVSYYGPLLVCVLNSFQGAKIFTRTLAPMLEKHVEEGLFKWMEEQRIQKAIWDAVESSEIQETFRKKASQHIQKSYDDAHIKAPFGSSEAETPELAMLQDFVKGWMYEFATRAHDVLNYGMGGAQASRDQQVLIMTVLFQNLTNADNACLPHELTSVIETPPPMPWPFIAECAEAIFAEAGAGQAFKRRKGMGGKGMPMM